MKRVTERDEYLASQIIDLCARHFEINVEDILSRSRKREYAAPRQLAAYFIKQHTELSLSTIGKCLGGLDHSSVISSIRVINGLNEVDKKTKDDVLAISDMIMKLDFVAEEELLRTFEFDYDALTPLSDLSIAEKQEAINYMITKF
jgi:hypothetical protein